MKLTQDEIYDIVAYRMEKALRTLDQAIANYNMGYADTSVNRLFHAAYYAASALLMAKGFNENTPNEVKDKFEQNLVKSGIVSKEDGEFFNNLFKTEMANDYDDNTDLQLDDVKPLIEPTKQFVDSMMRTIAGDNIM